MMNTITCPKCGTENPANAVNCKQCRINLKLALEDPEEIERIKGREQGLAETSPEYKNTGEDHIDTYYLTKKARGLQLVMGVVALLVTVGAVWVVLTTRDPINRILFFLLVIGGGWTAIRTGLMALRSNPTLTIRNEDIMVSGWWPASNPNNWTRALPWSEIGQAKVVTKEVVTGPLSTAKTVSLILSSREEPEKALGTVAVFDKFEKTNEIVQVISERLGRPVLEESLRVEGGMEVKAEDEIKVRVEGEPKLSRADLEARITAGLCPKCEARVSPEDQNCPSCRISLVYARQNLDQLLR